MIPDGYLTAQANLLLSLAAAALGPGAPARQFVSVGEDTATAWDDEQLSVSPTETREIAGQLSGARGQVTSIHPGAVPMLSVRWMLELVKCYPTSESDDGVAAVLPADLTAAATGFHTLGTALWNMLEAKARAGDLVPAGRELAMFQHDVGRFLGPSGGMAGYRVSFNLTVV